MLSTWSEAVLAMFSLSSDHSKLSDISLTRHLSEVRQAEVTRQDHDVINSWPTGWMDRHFKDETRCNIPNSTGTNYDKGATSDEQKNELTILNSTDGYSASLITNPPSVVPLTTYASTVGVPLGKKSYIDTEEPIDNSWLVNEATTAFFNANTSYLYQNIAKCRSLHADFNTFLEIWKPNVELVDKSEVPQGTTATVRKLKDVLPNQVTLSAAPSLFRLNSLQNKIVPSNNKKEIAIKWYCVFCFNNARFAYEKCGIMLHPKLNGPWRTHVCKDSKGVVICPILAAHVCRHCGATGKFAHTEKYCDLEQKRRNERTKNLSRVSRV
ncbi:unnamed protein product [Wuchereria bancrofti]|uniref:Nanos-type domain-containing protein n=1 Tax=Wuchereria bancrofti TaxID=6293 RepID=A0A3P7E2L4_WUCBA|nr:unnamed protein product [Wuchereria bancrofti]